MASTTYTPYVEAEDYLKQAQAEALAAQKAENEAALIGYDTQAQTTQTMADKNAQGLYQNLMSSQRGLANQNQAGGLYRSGYAETSNVNLLNNYGTNYAANRENLASDLKSIADARAKQVLSGQSNISGINSTYAAELASLKQQQSDAAADAEQQAITNAYTAANAGDFSQLEALGIDTTYLKQLQALELAQQQASLNKTYSSGSGSGSGSGTKVDAITQERAIQDAAEFVRFYAHAGWSAKSILAKMENMKSSYVSLYGQDFWDVWQDYVMGNYPEFSSYTAPETETTTETYGAIYSEMLSKNNYNAARTWLNSQAGYMSNSELEYANSILADMFTYPEKYFTETASAQNNATSYSYNNQFAR